MIDLVGLNLGQYQIMEEVGAGGMATVYKAYQPGLDRFVAVKVLPPQNAMAEDYEQRFFREAKAVAQLNHPNILPIYDVGIENDISFFVMKFVPGRTLGDLMGEKMSLDRVSHFIGQVARALDHAHSRGILHRDIKPANMLLDEDDWLLLADFGLAKIMEGNEQLTATGMSMGTPSYASPEQVEGMEADHRTDIYSLGIVLYQMVTGELPYQGNTPMSIMFKHVHEPLPDPRELNPDLPASVDTVIRKATAKNFKERYDSAGELADDLRRCLHGGTPVATTVPVAAEASTVDDNPNQTIVLDNQPVTAAAEVDPNATVYLPTDKPQASNRNKLLIGGAVVAVVLLALAFFLWPQSQEEPVVEDPATLAQNYETTFTSNSDPAIRLRALADLLTLEGYEAQSQTLFNSLSVEDQAQLFAEAPADASTQVRPVALATYTQIENSDFGNQVLESMQTALSQSDAADDRSLANEIDNWLQGRAAAAQGDNAQAVIAYSVAIGLNDQNPATYFERAQSHINQQNYSEALADLETVATMTEGWNDQIAQTVEGNPPFHRALWEIREQYPGVTALVSRPANTATPTPTPTDTPTPTLTPSPTATPRPSPTPTATSTPATATQPQVSSGFKGGPYQLAFTKWDGGQHNLYVANTDGENEQFLLNRAAGPSWAVDGSAIYFYGEPGVDRQNRGGVDYLFERVSSGLVRMDADPLPVTVDDVSLFQAGGWNVGSARSTNISPDGTIMMYDARPGGGYRIYYAGTDGGSVRFELDGEQADWSPDGQKIVYRSGREGRTGIWIANWDDSGYQNLTNNGTDSFPAWSPDGKTIAFSRDETGNVDIYTIKTDGTDLQRLTDAPGPDTLPTFTPGGDIIFRTARDGQWAIWKMTANGDRQTVVIPDAGVGDDWAFSKMDVR